MSVKEIKDPLKEAMLEYAPKLANDYKRFVKQGFKNMQEALGPNLKGVYSHPLWFRTFQVIKGSLEQVMPKGGLSHGFYQYKYKISPTKLDKEAKKYGETTALRWYDKMREKLGMLSDVIVSKPSLTDEVIVNGRYKDSSVVIIQHRILNVSSLGTPFHQFPARIYVNNQFYSERDYKKLIRGWKVPEVAVEKKPKRPPIDPMSRPREFHFEYKRDLSATEYRPASVGITERQYAKGMTEEEAWKKISRMEERFAKEFGYQVRIYDVRVTSIRAWNGTLLWKEG